MSRFAALFGVAGKFFTASRIYAWLSVAFVGLASAVLSWTAGYTKGYEHAEALGSAAYSTLDALHAKAVATAERDARMRLEKAQARIVELTDQLQTKTTELKDTKHALKHASNRVTTVYVPALDAAPIALPEPVFTWGFVRLWNDAVGAGAAGVSQTRCATRTATTADTTEAAHTGLCDDLSPSGLTQNDLLHWIADYGERCQGIEARLRTHMLITPEF